MIRPISALMLFSVLAMSACALDNDGAREVTKAAAGGGVSDVDAASGIPTFVDHDASSGTGSAVLVGAGADGAQDASVVTTPDAGVITDSSVPPGPPPKPGDEKKEAGKE